MLEEYVNAVQRGSMRSVRPLLEPCGKTEKVLNSSEPTSAGRSSASQIVVGGPREPTSCVGSVICHEYGYAGDQYDSLSAGLAGPVGESPGEA